MFGWQQGFRPPRSDWIADERLPANPAECRRDGDQAGETFERLLTTGLPEYRAAVAQAMQPMSTYGLRVLHHRSGGAHRSLEVASKVVDGREPTRRPNLQAFKDRRQFGIQKLTVCFLHLEFRS